jgi:hypothetical protein
VVNLIDYIIYNIYSAISDWPGWNYYAARKREPGAQFKFFSWDSEASMTNDRLYYNKLAGGEFDAGPGHLFSRLRGNTEYCMLVADRLHKHLANGGVLTPDVAAANYLAVVAELEPGLVPESARWGDAWETIPITKNGAWVINRDWLLNTFFPNRGDIILGFFRNFGVYPDIDPPSFNQHGGEVPQLFELTMSNPNGSGTIYYTLGDADPRSPSVSGTASSTTLLETDASKKVLIPTGNIGTTWWGGSEPYDDSTWTAGTPIIPGKEGGVGFERSSGYQNYITYDVAAMYGVNSTCYIRVPFTVASGDLTGVNFARLLIRYDDGFIAYLNGVKIAEAYAPGSPAWNSGATAYNEFGNNFNEFDITDHLGDFLTGNNILAIHGLNFGTTSSDLLISVKLIVGEDTGAPAGISAEAIEYTGPIALTGSTVVRARVLDGEEWSAVTEASFLVSTAAPGDIIITEVLPNANNEDDNKEWFEIYNITDSAIDINGWKITDNGTDSHTINNGGPLNVPAKGYLVLGQSTNPALNGEAPVDYAYGLGTIALGNGGDEIILWQGDQVIHAIGYEIFDSTPTSVTDTHMNAAGGIAIGMAVDYCTGEVSFWQPQSSLYGTNGDTGTPGADNDGVTVCGAPDTTPPVLVESKFARRNLIFLRFNEPLDPTTAETASHYSVDQGVGVATSAIQESAAVVVIGFSALLSDVVYTVNVTGVEDTQENPIVLEQATVSFHTPTVSITEIMYNNRGTDVDWIELYNTTGGTVDLSGWYISDDDVYPAVGEGNVTLPSGTTIESGQYLIVNLWDAVDFSNWQMPGNVNVVNAVVADPGSLANDGDNLVLHNAALGGTLIDGSLTTDYPDLTLDGESIEKMDELFPWGDGDTIGYNFRRCTTPLGFTTGTDGSGNPLTDFATPGRTNGSEYLSVSLWRTY